MKFFVPRDKKKSLEMAKSVRLEWVASIIDCFDVLTLVYLNVNQASDFAAGRNGVEEPTWVSLCAHYFTTNWEQAESRNSSIV